MAPSMDAIVTPYLRLSFGGTIGVPEVEVWSNTLAMFAFDTPSMPTKPQLQAAVNAASIPIAEWYTSLGMTIGDAAALKYVKLNAMDSHNHQRDLETIRHDYVNPPVTSYNSPAWYQTFAQTLRTGSSRGRAHAGRIFPPLVVKQLVGKTPYISAADAGGMATATATLITALNTTVSVTLASAGYAGGNFRCGVISPGSVERGTEEARSVFTRVVVDRVPDVQHRRTKQVARAEGPSSNIPA